MKLYIHTLITRALAKNCCFHFTHSPFIFAEFIYIKVINHLKRLEIQNLIMLVTYILVCLDATFFARRWLTLNCNSTQKLHIIRIVFCTCFGICSRKIVGNSMMTTFWSKCRKNKNESSLFAQCTAARRLCHSEIESLHFYYAV